MNNELDKTAELKHLTKQLLTDRVRLSEILSETEETKITLSVVRQEYYSLVGDIVYKTALTDTEINRLNRYFEFENNMDVNTSILDVDQEYTAAKEKIEHEFGKLNNQDSINVSSLSDEDRTELRNLWKKLSKIYHPDLGGSDPEMMVKINKAYESGDIDFLRSLGNNGNGTLEELNSVDLVRKLLEDVEKSINKSSVELRKLKLSFWYDLFLQLSRSSDRNLVYEELSSKLNIELNKKLDELEKLKALYDRKK